MLKQEKGSKKCHWHKTVSLRILEAYQGCAAWSEGIVVHRNSSHTSCSSLTTGQMLHFEQTETIANTW